MPSLNKVILIGNLVADPELKQLLTALSVTSFRIGVQRRFAKDSAQQQTDFINIVCWRQTAEFVTRYFTKGRPILVCVRCSLAVIPTRTATSEQRMRWWLTKLVRR